MKAPALASHIELYPFEENKINIFNKDTGKTFVAGEKESKVLKMLDGNHTFSEIESACPFFTPDQIQQLVKAFADIGLFSRTKERKNVLKLKLPVPHY